MAGTALPTYNQPISIMAQGMGSGQGIAAQADFFHVDRA